MNLKIVSLFKKYCRILIFIGFNLFSIKKSKSGVEKSDFL